MIVHHVLHNGDVFEGGHDHPGDGMVPRAWWRINGEAVTQEEFVRRWRLGCDHKFIDSRACVKCGWVPPDDEILTDVEGSPLVLKDNGGSMLRDVIVLPEVIREATMARLRQIITLSARADQSSMATGLIRELAERALVDLTHLEAKP